MGLAYFILTPILGTLVVFAIRGLLELWEPGGKR